MSATTTTNIKQGDLISYSVKVNGSAIPESFQILSIKVIKAVNRISSASIVLLDGSASQESFPISSSSYFVPGNVISIEAGYNGQNQLIFKGIVTKQSLRVDDVIGSALTVECKDQAVKMTVGRKSASFYNTTDSQVMTALIAAYSGLSAKVTATSENLAALVQYYCSDWDFMLSWAEING